MYELIKAADRTYYINCPAKIGIYVDVENSAYLIDSGNDKDAGKKVKKILDENGWNLKAVINTHSHADHIGGNNYLGQQTGCKIYAKGIECSFTLSPILEPSFLSGSYPHKDLQHKFLMAQPSICQDISNADLPSGFEIIDLSGHSFDMIGVRTPDNVVFAADCVSSEAAIHKYGISYIYDVAKYIDTLENVKKLKAGLFIPSHADCCADMEEICDVNLAKVYEIASYITDCLSMPMSFESLLKTLFEKYSLTMTNEQYVLIGSTVKSYLSYLRDSGKIENYFEDNMMLWKTK